MVRAEAGADERELAALRIEHRQLPVRALERKDLRGRMARALAAELRVLRRPHARRVPDTPALIEHRVVRRGVAVPDWRPAPVRRWRNRVVLARGRLGIAHRVLE